MPGSLLNFGSTSYQTSGVTIAYNFASPTYFTAQFKTTSTMSVISLTVTVTRQQGAQGPTGPAGPINGYVQLTSNTTSALALTATNVPFISSSNLAATLSMG